MKIKASNPFQREFFAPSTPLARAVLRRGASWRPSPWQGLPRGFQGRGTSGNIQCLRTARSVPRLFDGTSRSDNRPPEPARGGRIQLWLLVLPAPERGSEGGQGVSCLHGGCPGLSALDQLLVAHWSGPGAPPTHTCLVPGVSCARSGDALRASSAEESWEPPLGMAPLSGSSPSPGWHKASLGVPGAPHSSRRGGTLKLGCTWQHPRRWQRPKPGTSVPLRRSAGKGKNI